MYEPRPPTAYQIGPDYLRYAGAGWLLFRDASGRGAAPIDIRIQDQLFWPASDMQDVSYLEVQPGWLDTLEVLELGDIAGLGTFQLFPDWSLPILPDTALATATNLGTRIYVDVPGEVLAVRFYKAAANTGTHVGGLWTAAGELRGQVTFSGESASGWQQQAFSTPIAVSPGLDYIASYFAPVGHYARDVSFWGAPRDAGSLHGANHAVHGNNGQIRSSASFVFPDASGSGACYYVDVVFRPTG